MGGLKSATAYVTAFVLSMALILTSCGNWKPKTKVSKSHTPGVENNMYYGIDEKIIDAASDKKNNQAIGDYQYPENPAEQLRNAMEKDTVKRGLPMVIGDVEKIEFEGKECSQFKINFIGSENMCVISFINKYINYGYEETLNGRDNPSFTMAFKEPDNSRDMIIALSCVIKYLAPELSLGEAERLATKQDETISIDGYSMPKEIGGYQIQTRYTNPHVFVRMPDFDAKFGVTVRAIRQIWRGSVDSRICQELITAEDYELLNVRHWKAEEHPEIVYGDFIVKNIWQDQSYLHGETWVVLDVESITGRQYSLSFDTWEYPYAYEFGVGQQYTLFIRLNYQGGIVYAVQRSESAQFNSRGEVHPIDYPVVDWENPVVRVEPETEGKVYDLSFLLKSQSYGEKFTAIEGCGAGEAQWPKDPVREGYAFAGWYDNLDWDGEPYTKDTPIYKDISLYAKWKYSGSGGIWPRSGRGGVQGIDKESNFSVGQDLLIRLGGYNMNLEKPQDQRFRWYPTVWRLSDGTDGSFLKEAPFQAVLHLNSKGVHGLYITYVEEIFDGVDWQSTGQSIEVEEAMVRVDR